MDAYRPYPNNQIRREPINTTSIATALVNNAYTPASGSFIDTRDIGDGAYVFSMLAGALADTVVMKVYQSTTATSSGAKVVTDKEITLVADKLHLIEVRPRDHMDLANGFRFLSLRATGIVGNNYAAISYETHMPNLRPVTQPATTLTA
jgi:hypothetical protein